MLRAEHVWLPMPAAALHFCGSPILVTLSTAGSPLDLQARSQKFRSFNRLADFSCRSTIGGARRRKRSDAAAPAPPEAAAPPCSSPPLGKIPAGLPPSSFGRSWWRRGQQEAASGRLRAAPPRCHVRQCPRQKIKRRRHMKPIPQVSGSPIR